MVLKRRVKAVNSAITAFDIGPSGGILAFGTSEGAARPSPLLSVVSGPLVCGLNMQRSPAHRRAPQSST